MPPNLTCPHLFLFLSFVQANFKCNNNIALYIIPELWNGQEMFCITAITVLFTKPDLRFRISWHSNRGNLLFEVEPKHPMMFHLALARWKQ